MATVTITLTDEDDSESYALHTAIWLTDKLIKAREAAAQAVRQA